MKPDNRTLREWLINATPGTIIEGNNSGRRYVVTESHTLNGIGTTSQPTNSILANRISAYHITPPEEPKPNRPKPGERVKVTIEGTVTEWVASGAVGADDFEIRSDDGRYHYFNTATKPKYEVIKPPLPTKPGTVLTTRVGTKYILVGDQWRTLDTGTAFNTSVVQSSWDRGDLILGSL
jgi:hypothetical protein